MEPDMLLEERQRDARHRLTREILCRLLRPDSEFWIRVRGMPQPSRVLVDACQRVYGDELELVEDGELFVPSSIQSNESNSSGRSSALGKRKNKRQHLAGKKRCKR